MSDISVQPFLEIRGIRKKFGSVEALKGVDLKAYSGEVLAIVGDNGAGKSTIIKILSGAITPDSGEIIIAGKKYNKLNPKTALAAGISTVYQDLALVNTLNTPDNIFLGREYLKYLFCLDEKKMRQETRRLMEQLGIQIPSLHTPVCYLSGGQRQSVAVARAVHQGGRLLIFDEPTAAMGLKETVAVLKLIKSLAGQKFGVIVISHNMEQVFKIADRICIIRQGEVVDYLKADQVSPQDVVAMITGAIDLEETNNYRCI
ncbi:MAG TPA: sugar ABC transporter ATP-binding protein [Desulfotomaculum sp.]|nr:MAG: ABC transporter, ATP-binding protein [Desulfotomaculum sp. 46_80]HAG11464.1 sugar ABC transporter ATP-binding protein [Desulfotomaculum sp.]HBY03081.1 sugar ABC transporter ATP-binding protein [Desulfotomaculum sp.]